MLPPALYPHRSTIAVATPASPPRDIAAFEAGLAYLQSIGFKVKTNRRPFLATGYLSADDYNRAAELNGFIADPEVDAIFCTRGGYGSARLLPLIDFETARQNPKLLIGYSDITTLQLAFYQAAGWRSLSGPMVAVDWGKLAPVFEQQFLRLTSGASNFCLAGANNEPLEALKAGQCTGILLGGNLTVLTRLIGTPYLPSLERAILFIEDVNEPAYKVDAMLAHLKLSGIWHKLGGLIIGQFTSDEHPNSCSPEILEVFQDYCRDVNFPVASGLRYGHIPEKIAMPIGVEARLTFGPDHAQLFLLEPLVNPQPPDTNF